MQRSWKIQKTLIELPAGRIAGLGAVDKRTGNKFYSRSMDYLYFGTSTFERITIRGKVSQEDYESLKDGLEKQKEIEFMQGGKVSGHFLSYD
ncbi:MAG: hypothetical protein ACPGSB_00035 [Opitutales bacterium]